MQAKSSEIWQREPPPPAGETVLLAYPKAGRTWLRYMLDCLGATFHLSHGGAAHVARAPFEAIAAGPELYRRCRILFLLRDPRDTAVSGFLQASRRKCFYDGDLAAFLRDPRHGLEKIILFNRLWLGAADQFADFHAMHYERLQADAAAELAVAARFVMGRDPDGEAVANAVQAGSFETMHALEASGEGAAIYGADLRPRDPDDPESYKTRRGIIGGWRDYFSADDTAYAEEIFDRHGYRPLLDITGTA